MTVQTTTGDVVPSFSAMLRGVLGDRLAIDLGPDATFRDMFAEDGVMEFPFAPPGFTTRLDGRAALTAYLDALGRQIEFGAMSQPVVHETRDPSVVVLEFTGSGRGTETGHVYEQAYISVVTTREGRIARYRDYWNPLVVLDAMDPPAIPPAAEDQADA